jgi:hypothetical protein
MMKCAGVEVQLDGNERSVSLACSFTPSEADPGMYWMGLRSGVDAALENKSLVVTGIISNCRRMHAYQYNDRGTPHRRRD